LLRYMGARGEENGSQPLGWIPSLYVGVNYRR